MFENKRRSITILVLLLIVAAAGFYVVWGIFLNKGTVIFTGKPPFTVTIGENAQTCVESGCEFLLGTGEYNFIISKEGYYDKTGFVIVERGDRISVEADLEFIVEVFEGTEYEIFSLPLGYSKFRDRLLDITLFNGYTSKQSLKRLPKKIENIHFSPSGEKAFVFEQDKVSLYNTQNFYMDDFAMIQDSKEITFTRDESNIYTISFDEDANKYALKKVSLSDKKIRSLIFFGRDITEYELSVSPDEKFVAVTDKTFQPQILYMIDLEEQSRENIFEGYTIDIGVWNPDSSLFVFNGKKLNEDMNSLWFYNSLSGVTYKFEFFTNILDFDFLNSDTAYFVTNNNYNISTSQFPFITTFEEAAEEEIDITLLTEIIEEEPETISLHKWVISEGQYYLTEDLSEMLTGIPDKIEISEDGKIIRILSENLYYDIKIEE